MLRDQFRIVLAEAALHQLCLETDSDYVTITMTTILNNNIIQQ